MKKQLLKRVRGVKTLGRTERDGEVRIEALVANPQNRNLNCCVNFLVDTGAGVTVIPKKVADNLNLQKHGVAHIRLADGRIVELDLTYIYLYVAHEGLFTFATINENADAILGIDVMKLLEFQIDVAQKKVLRPVRRTKLIRIILFQRVKGLCKILSNKH